MTLDFSHRDDNFTASMRFDESKYDYGRYLLNFDESMFQYGKDRNDRGGSCESKDILDLLPADPFGMNMGATFSALTDWFGGFERKALQFICNNAMKFPSEAGNLGMRMGNSFNRADEFDMWFKYEELGDPLCHGTSSSMCGNDPLCHGTSSGMCGNDHVAKEVSKGNESCSSNQSGGEPNDAFNYVLAYLGVPELLSVERVCKSLHSAVPSDSLLWRSIYIDHPLSDKIDDTALLRLTSRAQGSLKSLSLVKCPKITDKGLKQVLESNPRLEKLIIPDCTRLSAEGIVNSLKDFQSYGASNLKQLRLGGRFDVTQEHFEELKLLLGIDECVPSKPRIYGQLSGLYKDNDDYRVIDIEICPRCDNLRLVYDCPLNSCQAKQDLTACRACKFCIFRCDHCGRCLSDVEYDEDFSLDVVCLHCGQQQPKGTTTPEVRLDSV